MIEEDGRSCEENGLEFFGQMSASICHELKNTLAIINENAGLLDDLVSLERQDTSRSHARLLRLAHTIRQQVSRADQIVKKMNRFTRSIDTAAEKVNVPEVVSLVTDVADWLIRMHSMRINAVFPDEPLTVLTNRFHLENLIWRCLESIVPFAACGNTIRLKVEALDAGARIRFSHDAARQPALSEAFSTPRTLSLITRLGIKHVIDPSKAEMMLVLPDRAP